jgi:hypothetical protein
VSRLLGQLSAVQTGIADIGKGIVELIRAGLGLGL